MCNIHYTLDVSENSGTPLKNRVFHCFHHPFWATPIFWKHPNMFWNLFTYRLGMQIPNYHDFTKLRGILIGCSFGYQSTVGDFGKTKDVQICQISRNWNQKNFLVKLSKKRQVFFFQDFT